MTQEEMKQLGCTPIEDFITEDFGAIGTEERNAFELGCDAFLIGEHLKKERISAGLTQQQLAEKIGSKKSFISRIEHGKVDIKLSTLYRLFNGLGRQVSFAVL